MKYKVCQCVRCGIIIMFFRQLVAKKKEDKKNKFLAGADGSELWTTRWSIGLRNTAGVKTWIRLLCRDRSHDQSSSECSWCYPFVATRQVRTSFSRVSRERQGSRFRKGRAVRNDGTGTGREMRKVGTSASTLFSEGPPRRQPVEQVLSPEETRRLWRSVMKEEPSRRDVSPHRNPRGFLKNTLITRTIY